MSGRDQLEALRQAIEESEYTVALGGSGLLEESGYLVMKNPDKAYDLLLLGICGRGSPCHLVF